jgi:hypothetical protein
MHTGGKLSERFRKVEGLRTELDKAERAAPFDNHAYKILRDEYDRLASERNAKLTRLRSRPDDADVADEIIGALNKEEAVLKALLVLRWQSG